MRRLVDEGLAPGGVFFGVCLKARSVEDDDVGAKLAPFHLFGPDKEVSGKERVPGALGDDPHPEAVGGVGPGVEVLDV